MIQADMTLKTDPGPFRAVWRGQKKAELRLNDRDFQVGDRVRLIEYDRVKGLWIGERRQVIIEITHVTMVSDFMPISSDVKWAMLSFRVIKKQIIGIRGSQVCRGCRGER